MPANITIFKVMSLVPMQTPFFSMWLLNDLWIQALTVYDFNL